MLKYSYYYVLCQYSIVLDQLSSTFFIALSVTFDNFFTFEGKKICHSALTSQQQTNK